MPKQKPRLAVLIDAENVGARQVEGIHETIVARGDPVLWRAYGAFARPNMRVWSEFADEHPGMALHESGATGKNGADIALAVDATNLINTRSLEGLCLVSADSDFAPLARHARRRGLAAYGFGRRHSPAFYRNAFTRFFLIEELQPAPKAAPPPKPSPEGAKRLINKALGGRRTWLPMSALGHRLRDLEPTFRPQNYGSASLSKLLIRCGGYQVRGDGSERKMRPRPSGRLRQ